jgi:hypothetical protein
MNKVLFVVTGADHWTLADGTKHPTGFWAEEVVAPYKSFTSAGYQVVVATPGGVLPTVDRASLAADANGGQDHADAIDAELAGIEQMKEPLRLEDISLDDYAAVSTPVGTVPWKTYLATPTRPGYSSRPWSPVNPSAWSATPPLLCSPPSTPTGPRRSPDSGSRGSPMLKRRRLGWPVRLRGCSRIASLPWEQNSWRDLHGRPTLWSTEISTPVRTLRRQARSPTKWRRRWDPPAGRVEFRTDLLPRALT